jgi:hypothetical protein
MHQSNTKPSRIDGRAGYPLTAASIPYLFLALLDLEYIAEHCLTWNVLLISPALVAGLFRSVVQCQSTLDGAKATARRPSAYMTIGIHNV